MGRKSREKAARRASRARAETADSSSPVEDGFGPGEPEDAPPWLPTAPMVGRAVDRAVAVAGLRALAARQREAQRDVEDQVRRHILDGHSWTALGDALGLSRQGARQRYRRLLTDLDHQSRDRPAS